VYTDGSCINNGTEEAQAGSGIWYGENDPRNRALKVPGKEQSNQTGELYALLYVVKTTSKQDALLIKSDSRYAIDGLTKHLQSWENRGWIGVSNKELFQVTAAWMRARENSTVLQWVKGHNRAEREYTHSFQYFQYFKTIFCLISIAICSKCSL
jgi:ribonuclease HI